MSTGGPMQPVEPTPRRPRVDNALLAIDVLIVLVGLGIVARGLLQHGSPYYIALGVVFAVYGLWRLRQRLRARRDSG